MVTVQGTVHNGLVKLPDAIHLLDGVRVMVTILDPLVKNNGNAISEKIETEDIEFVRACRGRLAQQLRAEE